MENKVFCLVATLIVTLSGCYKESVVAQGQVILSMKNMPSGIPADGVSKTLISLELPQETTDANNSIVFTTTKGLFDLVLKNTATINAQNVIGADSLIHKIATINLVSTTDEGPAIITATIKNYSLSDTINFTRAYPDSIFVFVDKLNYQFPFASTLTNSEVTVTVQIKRKVGTGIPSIGQTISLSAVDSTINGIAIGNFRNKSLTTDAAGACVNYFSLPPTNTYLGTIK